MAKFPRRRGRQGKSKAPCQPQAHGPPLVILVQEAGQRQFPDEILVSGKLAEVMDEIAQVRSEAQARNGWIMDTYLIRKPEKS